jgi:hypothetical protein
MHGTAKENDIGGLVMEEQEDTHANEEEVLNEDFDRPPPYGTVHWLLRLFIGLCPAGE